MRQFLSVAAVYLPYLLVAILAATVACSRAFADWTPAPDGSWTFTADVAPAPLARATCDCAVTGKCLCSDACQCAACVTAVPQAVTIPKGFHAHTRTDGTTFIHGNENRGKAGPHEGVARPWDKSGVAGDTVMIGDPFSVMADDCPGGRCPTGGVRGRFLSIAAPTSYSARITERSGPARGLFGRLREWRENRRGR